MPPVIARPTNTEYAPWHGAYIASVPEGDILDVLERQGRETTALLGSVDESRAGHRYAPGKWSIREVAGHIADAERVFTYRALSFARGDGTPLPSFDENAWAASSNADRRPLRDHVAELGALRGATVALFRGFTADEFARVGSAGGHPVSVRALAFIVAGHERHHLTILRERYGVGSS